MPIANNAHDKSRIEYLLCLGIKYPLMDATHYAINIAIFNTM